MYCSHCGNEIDPQDEFCTKCGSAVSNAPDHAVPVSEQTAEQAATETAVWVLNAQRKLSLFKRVACNIIFMPDKAVFAHLSPHLQKAEMAKAYETIKEKGVNFLKRSIAMMQYWPNYSKKYYSMTVEQILSEDPTNFLIPYQSIKKVLFKCESTTIDADGSASGSHGKLKISLQDGKVYNFTHQLSHDKAVKEVLTKLLNEKLKYRKQSISRKIERV